MPDVIAIIAEFYQPDSLTYRILLDHGRQVAEKALEAAAAAAHLKPDLRFIEEAAMLHDIGIFLTDTPKLECTGTYPYVAHGYLGRELLEKRGLNSHALVCDRHVGVGISAEDIRRFSLPLPLRDMLPLTIEEQIVCYADKFYSKSVKGTAKKKSVEKIRRKLERYGDDKVKRFDRWVEMFER